MRAGRKNIDAIYVAVLIDVVGWALWFRMAAHLDWSHAPRWVLADAYTSTALLGVSTACTAGALLLEAAHWLWWIVIVAGVVALAVFARSAWARRGTGAGPRVGPLRMDTARAEVDGWEVIAAPPPLDLGRGSWTSRTVREIETMEVT